eukprot:TRINITY_DN16758_c0_g1_i3.p1 TRINITY_DN16758_c0_g1~~TRINITY_DN16758_c0_g1_i3.p1  ORF type:complete len:1232 (+),score=242.35 TRINITY_DN16758_c0_g1_i3:51-3698(+)
MLSRIIFLTVLSLIIGSVVCQFTSTEEEILKRFHKDFLRHTKLSIDDLKALIAKENPAYANRNEVQELTNIDYMCGAPVAKCVNDMFKDKQQSAWIDFMMRDCDNATCGASFNAVMNCNDTCSSELLNQEQSRDCSYKCGLSMPAPEGMQIELMTFYDSGSQHFTPSFTKDDQDTPPNEGIVNLMSPFLPKYFDRNVSSFNITFNNQNRVNVTHFTFTTADDEPGRDIVDWKLEALLDDGSGWALISMLNFSNSSQLTPEARRTQTTMFPVEPICYDKYDQQYGLGQCDYYVNQASIDCATKFCPTCEYSGYCDYTCSLKGAATNWCPAFPNGYTTLRFTPLKLRDNGTCVGEDIDRDVWWTNETTKAHKKCGLPWMATDDWYCFSNVRNTIDCPNEKYDCNWNSVNTELNFTTGLYVDTFQNAKCNQIEQADDSHYCIANIWEQYYEQVAKFYTCGIMWNCMRRDISGYIDNCETNHITYDMDGDKCDQKPICAAINKTLSIMPQGNVSCDWEHARATGSSYPFWNEILDECSAKLCDVFGDPRAKPGYCDVDRPEMMTCCVDGVYVLNRTVNDARTYVTFPLLTCDQLEYLQAFEDSCRLVSGPIEYMAPECEAYGEAYIWKDRLQSLDGCLAQGDIWRDKYNKTCNTTRICDLAGSAVLGACDRKPVGLQKCSSSRVQPSTWNTTFLLQNMTLDNDGYCRCIAPSVCGPGGYCSGVLAPPDTPPPPPVNCSSSQAISCLTAWQGCTDPMAPIPDIWGIPCAEYVENPTCTTPYCAAMFTPVPLNTLTPATSAPVTLTPRVDPTPAPITQSPRTAIPTHFPTLVPTYLPTPGPPTPRTFVPTTVPTDVPPPPRTPVPTAVPTPGPPIPRTFVPTTVPTDVPPPPRTLVPTAVPSHLTAVPTGVPAMPTAIPTGVPATTAVPSHLTAVPTGVPAMPTAIPTGVPATTAVPSHLTAVPTGVPGTPRTDQPAIVPTTAPTTAPTTPKTMLPAGESAAPTTAPTIAPTMAPVPKTMLPAGESAAPTTVPTMLPAGQSAAPTTAPTMAPVPRTMLPAGQSAAPTAIPTAVPPRTPLPSGQTAVPTTIPATVAPSSRISGNCSEESSSEFFCAQFTNCRWVDGTCRPAPVEEKEKDLTLLIILIVSIFVVLVALIVATVLCKRGQNAKFQTTGGKMHNFEEIMLDNEVEHLSELAENPDDQIDMLDDSPGDGAINEAAE